MVLFNIFVGFWFRLGYISVFFQMKILGSCQVYAHENYFVFLGSGKGSFKYFGAIHVWICSYYKVFLSVSIWFGSYFGFFSNKIFKFDRVHIHGYYFALIGPMFYLFFYFFGIFLTVSDFIRIIFLFIYF